MSNQKSSDYLSFHMSLDDAYNSKTLSNSQPTTTDSDQSDYFGMPPLDNSSQKPLRKSSYGALPSMSSSSLIDPLEPPSYPSTGLDYGALPSLDQLGNSSSSIRSSYGGLPPLLKSTNSYGALPVFTSPPKLSQPIAITENSPTEKSPTEKGPAEAPGKLKTIIIKQEFSGKWTIENVSDIIGISVEFIRKFCPVKTNADDIWATSLIVAYLGNSYGDCFTHWDICGKKAKKWLAGKFQEMKANAADWEKKALEFVKNNVQMSK